MTTMLNLAETLEEAINSEIKERAENYDYDTAIEEAAKHYDYDTCIENAFGDYNTDRLIEKEIERVVDEYDFKADIESAVEDFDFKSVIDDKIEERLNDRMPEMVKTAFFALLDDAAFCEKLRNRLFQINE
jgi:hypothetical protein